MKVSPLARSSTNRRRRTLRRVLAGSVATALAAHVVSAVTYQWDANGTGPGQVDGTGTWNDGNQNWFNGSTNVQWNSNLGLDAQFGYGGTAASIVAVPVPISVANMTFTALGPNYTISASSSDTRLTFLGANPTITTNSDATLKIGLLGTAITKEGAGRLVIRGVQPSSPPDDAATTSNDYAGLLKVNNGLLQFGGNYNIEAGIRDNFAVGALGTLRLNQSNIIRRIVVGTVDGYMELAGYSETFGALAGTGVVSTAIGASSIKLDNGTQNFAGSIRGPISLTIAGSDGATTNGAVQTLSGINSYTGATLIESGFGQPLNHGSLILAHSLAAYRSAISVQPTNGLKFSPGIGSFLIGGIAGMGNIALADTAGNGINLRAGSSDNTSFPVYTGIFTDAGNGSISSFTKTGINTQTFAPSTPHTYLGATGIDRGKLVLDFSNLATPVNLINSASPLRLGGGTLQINAGSTAASQTFGGFTVGPGGGTIALSAPSSSAVLTLPANWTRNTGGTVNFDLRDFNTAVLSSPTLTNDVIAWGNVLDGSDVGYVTSAGGAIARYTGAAGASSQAGLTSATTNYDVNFAADPNQFLTADRAANTIRSIGSGATIELNGHTLSTNALMNAYSSDLTVQATAGGALAAGASNSLAVHLAGFVNGGNLTQGNLIISAPIVNNGANPSSLTVQSAVGSFATLTLSGASTFSGGTFLNGGTTIVDASSTSNANGVISGPFGTGKLTFGGGNIQGSTGFSAAPLVIGNNIDFLRDTVIPQVANGTKSLNFSGTVTLLDGPRTITSLNSLDTIFSGPIVDGLNAAGLTVTGATGTRILFQGANTYTGLTTVNQGTLQIGNGLFAGTLGTGPVYVNPTGILSFNRADDITILNEITGSGILQQDKASTVLLVNPHDQIGKLVIGAEGGIIDVGAVSLSLNGLGAQGLASGTIKASAGGRLVLDAIPQFQVADGRTLNISAPIIDGVTNTVRITTSSAAGTTGSGIVLFSGASTYSGPTNLNAGTLAVTRFNSFATNAATGAVRTAGSSLGAPGTPADAVINLGSLSGGLPAAILRYVGTGEITDRPLNLVSSGAKAGRVDMEGTGTLKFLADLNAGATGIKQFTLSGNSSGVGEFAGIITDAGGNNQLALIKSGSGTWRLSAANSYTGITQINAGKLVAVASAAVSSVIPAHNFSNAFPGDTVAALHMRGGTFQYIGTGGTQTIDGVGFITGANVIDASSTGGAPVILDLNGGDNLVLKALVRLPVGGSLLSDGTVDFQTSNPGQTVGIAGANTLGNVTIKAGTTNITPEGGVFGAWATVNKGAALATIQNVAANATTYLAVVPYTGYFDVITNGGIGNAQGRINNGVPTNYTNNTLHFRFGSGYSTVGNSNPTIATGIMAVRTLTQDSTQQAVTLNMSANALRVGIAPGGSTSLPTIGGIFVTPQGKSLTLGQTPGEGSGLSINFVASGGMPWNELILGNFSVASAQTPVPSQLTLNTNIINPVNANFLQVPVRLILSGPGIVNLNGPENTFNGGVYLFNGTLNLNTPSALGFTSGPMAANAAINLGIVINGGNLGNTSGGTVRLPDGRSQNWAADFTYDSVNPIIFGGGANGSVTLTEAQLANINFTRKVTVANAAMSIGGAVGGSATLVKDGAGDLNFYANGASAFDGGLIIRQGTVAALANGTTFGANAITLGDATGSGNAALAGGPSGAGYANDISVVGSGGGTKTIRNALDYATRFTGTITVGAPLTIGTAGAGSVNIAGLLSGSGLVTVAAGNDRQNVVDFSTANGTFRGGVLASSGVLRLGTGSSLGDSVAGTSIVSGATVDLNGQTVSEPFALAGLGAKGAGALVNYNTATPAISNGVIEITSDAAVGGAGNLTLNGAIGGTGGASIGAGLFKVGAGSTTLTAKSTYTGSTFVRGGSLIADTSLSATVIDPQSKLVVSNATFQLTGAAGVSRTQILNGLHVSDGANSVVVNNTGTETILDLRGPLFALGFSHGTGTVDFRSTNPAEFGAAARILTTQYNEAAGAIGAYATVNGGAALATNNNGVITAFTGYTDLTSLTSAVIPDNSQAHVRINTGAAASLALAAATTNVFTLTQNSTTATTVNPGAGTLRLGGEAGVYLTPGSGALTLGTGNITAGGGSNNAAGSIIFNNSSASALTVNSTIANNGSGAVFITKTGAGSLTLNGANTFSGDINLQQGTLNLGHAAALGAGGNLLILGGTIDNTSGAPMTISGPGSLWAGDFTFAGTQPLTFGSVNRSVFLSDLQGQGTRTVNIPNAALTLNQPIYGSMALLKAGAGTLNLSGAASGFQGGLTIASGTVAAIDANATFGTGTLQIGDSLSNTDSATLIAGLRAAGYDNKLVTSNHTNGVFTGTLTVKSVAGSTLRLNGGVQLNDDLAITTQGIGGVVLNGALAGAGNLFLNAGSALGNVIELNGDNTFYLGKLQVDAGTVKLGQDGALGPAYFGTTIVNGAALDLNGVSITDGLIIAGTGINGKGALLNNSTRPATAGGGFQMLSTGTIVVNGTPRAVGETSVGGSGNITFTTPISSGSGFLTFAKQGTGTVTLNSGINSNYVGQTLVRRGTLIEDLTNIAQAATAGTINIASQLALDGGTFQLTGQTSEPNNTIKGQTFNGSGTPQIGGVTYGTYLTGGSSNIVIDQPATGGGGANTPPILRLALANIGRAGGTVHFSMLRGSNNFAQGVTTGTSAATAQISFSTAVDASGILGPWATLSTAANGTGFASKDATGFLFEYAGYVDILPGGVVPNGTMNNVRINGAASGNITLAAAVTDVNTLSQKMTLPQTVDTAGQQLRVGAVGGIVQFNTATQQGGGLTIGLTPNSGTVTAGGTTANAPGELVVSNFSNSAGITVNSAIVNNGSGAVKVTKGAAGTVTLAGPNNYSGGTFVEAGTLLVTGSIQGSTTVHTDATIGGTGTIGGLGTTLTVNLAGNLSPGTTGAGTLTTGSLSLADSAQFKFDLGGKLAGQFDAVNVNGTVTLGTLNAGPSLVASFLNGFNAVPGDSFKLINNDFSDPIVGTFATGNTYAVGNYVFNVNYAGGDGNDLVLTVAVPEPGSAALLLGAAAPLLGLRRFRRRSK